MISLRQSWIQISVTVVWLCILQVSTHSHNHGKHKHSELSSKRHHFYNVLRKKSHVTHPTNHVTQINDVNKNTIITKKAEIEGAIKTLENSDHKDKRGFLANLANLLNDAEAISGHKAEGLSSITMSDTKKTDVTNINTEEKKIESVAESAKKEETIPSSTDIQNALNVTPGKDFAPIFAMFHGKIIPLGKLPENAFKKSRTEMPPGITDENTAIPEKHSDVKPSVESGADQKKDETMNHENETTKTKEDTHASQTDDNEKKLKSEVTKLSKLKAYLTNLDGHSPETGRSKSVRGTVKDIVSFPEEEVGSPKSEILNHVKGVVLDNGKIVSVNNNNLVDSDESAKKSDDSQQKFIVTDDGSLTPVNKAKPEIGDAVARDQTGGSEGQKTVALSLDVLKDLLKKSDNKISLASLLNKNAETKSGTPADGEEDDPGTIEDFAAGGLKCHNEYRAKHHDDSLIWSDDLAAKAQKLAESLADKKTLEIAKDLEKEGYGENVAKVWATFKNAGEAATKMWYQQSDNYHFDDPHLDENTGQFAQLIWHATKELGMGVAKSIDDVNNKYVYVTALYKPPGNIEAALRSNVLPTGNNTVDVYTTFFKRGGVTTEKNKRSKLETKPQRKKNQENLNIVDEKD